MQNESQVLRNDQITVNRGNKVLRVKKNHIDSDYTELGIIELFDKINETSFPQFCSHERKIKARENLIRRNFKLGKVVNNEKCKISNTNSSLCIHNLDMRRPIKAGKT